MRKLLAFLVALVLTLAPTATMSQQSLPQGYTNDSRGFGYFTATVYNQWKAIVVNGNAATGSQTIQVQYGQYPLSDGTLIQPFAVTAPITIGIGSNAETVTPTAVSGCNLGAGNPLPSLCNVTATFANTHGQGEPIFSGTFGLQEAINDAFLKGGGMVVVDKAWGGTNAMLVAATPYQTVTILDHRFGPAQYWSLQGAAAAIATPATLTAVTALPSTTPVGTFTATNYNMCIAYVDIMGQEGPCSVTFVNAGAGATSSFIFSAPAASAGAVGYTIYIGLTGAGNGLLQYKVPLVTQPATVGPYPVSNGVCTLTTIETTTPACAVANTTYGQSGATATVSAITVNTSPIQPLASIVSTTTVFIPNPGGRSVYTYTPGSHVGVPGIPTASLAFPVSGSAASTVPTVLGTVNIPPGFMNYVGRTIEVCGRAGITTGSTTTVINLSFQWDSMGQNTAGKGVVIGNLGVTPVAAFSTTEMDSFCETFQTTVAAATATGGSINQITGSIVTSGVSAAAAGQGAGGDAQTGAIPLLNLAADARINVVYLHTTGTFAPTLQGLSVKVVN